MLDPVLEGLTYAGSFGAIWFVLALVLAGSSWRRPWLLARVGSTIIVAESVSGLLKDRIGRERPPLHDPDPAPLVTLPHTSSFPSGHSTVAFACALVLALSIRRRRWPLFALAALIAFSRIYVGVHYPFDVLGGAVLGLAIGLAVFSAGLGIRRVARARNRAGP